MVWKIETKTTEWCLLAVCPGLQILTNQSGSEPVWWFHKWIIGNNFLSMCKTFLEKHETKLSLMASFNLTISQTNALSNRILIEKSLLDWVSYSINLQPLKLKHVCCRTFANYVINCIFGSDLAKIVRIFNVTWYTSFMCWLWLHGVARWYGWV